MAYWLFKEEPAHYSFADLQADGEASWDGVENALALKHLRAVRKGDRIFYYHTGKEKAVVGVMESVADAQPDPRNPKLATVKVRPVNPLPRPVTLAEIKADEAFSNWELVRMSRLSVMPVRAQHWKRIEEMSKMAKD